MIKHRSQNAKRWMITLSQRNLNQILWLSPSLFLFSSSFSSSFLSFPATDQYIDTKDVTTQSTNTYDPFLSKFQISFFFIYYKFRGNCARKLQDSAMIYTKQTKNNQQRKRTGAVFGQSMSTNFRFVYG